MGSNKSIKVLLAIPAVVFAVGVCCLLLATLLERPTARGLLYDIPMVIFLICLFLGPLPCLVISVVGTIKALRARRDGTLQPAWLLALGIVEVLGSLFLLWAVVVAIFVTGPSV